MSTLLSRRFQHWTIIAQFDPLQVLLLREPQGWVLPHFESKEHNLGEVEYINQAVHSQLGVTTIALRCLQNRLDPSIATVYRIHVLENRSLGWIPPSHGKWVCQESVKDLPFAQPDHRVVLEAWFREQETQGDPQDGREWILPGWWNQATTWIQQYLNQRGVGESL